MVLLELIRPLLGGAAKREKHEGHRPGGTRAGSDGWSGRLRDKREEFQGQRRGLREDYSHGYYLLSVLSEAEGGINPRREISALVFLACSTYIRRILKRPGDYSLPNR